MAIFYMYYAEEGRFGDRRKLMGRWLRSVWLRMRLSIPLHFLCSIRKTLGQETEMMFITQSRKMSTRPILLPQRFQQLHYLLQLHKELTVSTEWTLSTIKFIWQMPGIMCLPGVFIFIVLPEACLKIIPLGLFRTVFTNRLQALVQKILWHYRSRLLQTQLQMFSILIPMKLLP